VTAVTGEEIIPYDDDFEFWTRYNGMRDSEFREVMARNMTEQHRIELFESAAIDGRFCCYETNFNTTPMYWPDKFENLGFELNMVFLCLDSVEEAKERVAIRVANGGHFVSEDQIEQRFRAGYKNLNTHFNRFQRIDLIDASKKLKTPVHVLTVSSGQVIHKAESIPTHLQTRLPVLSSLINSKP